MVRALKLWWTDQSGATSIEYAMIASVVSIMIVGAMVAMGTNLAALFASVTAGFGG